MQTSEPRPQRRMKGRIRLLLFVNPAIVARLKAQAQAETAANGGPIRKGGKGLVSVSDIIERWADREWNLSGQFDQSNA